MANNITVKDSAAADKVLKTTDTGGVHVTHHNIDSIAAGDNNIGNVDIVSGTITAVTAITNALPAGTNAIGKLAANSGVDIGDVDVTSVVPGTGATNLGKAEDGAHTSGDVGVMALGVRNEGHDDFSGTDKDYIPIAVDATGDVYVNVRHALPAGTAAIGKLAANSGVDIGDVDVTSIAAGENHLGAIGGNATVVTVTPTLTVHATYAAGDYVGQSTTPMTFASCARVNGGTGKITGAVMIDYALQSVAGELWLFDASVTPPNDSAAWSISDADSLKCIGVIPFGVYYASALNSVSPAPNLSIPFKAAAGATALYGCFVTRGAPAYASGDISFRLFIDQD